MIRVTLADDQVLVRAGFAALLDAEEDISVIGEAIDGREAVQLARRAKPDVVLMDIRMPGLDGIEATRQIAADPLLSATHVIILTTFDLDEYVFEGLRAGAAGFLVKDADPTDLIRAAVPHRAGTGGGGPHRERPFQRGHRRPPVYERLYSQDTRDPGDGQAGGPGQGATRGHRL